MAASSCKPSVIVRWSVRSVALPLHIEVRTAGSVIFALSGSFGVCTLPWKDQAGLNGVPLELSGKTDTIPTTFQAMRPGDAAAKVTTPIARLRRSLLCKIVFEATDVGDGLDLGAAAEPRSPQRSCDLAIADEHEVSVQLRSGLEDPRAVLRKAASFLLPCNALLTSSYLVSGRSLGCGQKPQLGVRPGRSLHLIACSMETP
jgi:hypothetical protein